MRCSEYERSTNGPVTVGGAAVVWNKGMGGLRKGMMRRRGGADPRQVGPGEIILSIVALSIVFDIKKYRYYQ
jgi:hypothetical protein